MKTLLHILRFNIKSFHSEINFIRTLSNGVPENVLSYYHNAGKKPLRAITVGNLLDEAAYKWPERRAIFSLHEDITITFQQLKEQADRLGAGLLRLGMKPGDRIAVLGPNTVHWCITKLAAAKAGLILVTVNPAYRTNELNYSLKKVGVKALITDESFKTQNYYEMLLEIDPNLANQPSGTKIKMADLPDLEYIIVKTDKELPGACRYIDIMNLSNNETSLYDIGKRIQPDDPVSIMYSSGTTGYPKAATLSHFGIVNNSHFFGERCGFHKKHHTLCLQVPLFHVFGSILGLLCGIDFGITLVFPGPSFKPETSLEAIRKEKFSAIYGTPTMYSDLLVAINNALDKPDNEDLVNRFSDFDIIVSGGAVCSPKLFTDLANVFRCTNVHSAYGMTETSPVMFTSTSEDSFEQRTTTVGSVAEHAEVKIVDNEGLMVPFGTQGEAWFRSYATMLKYWQDEEKTKETIAQGNWLKSGDLMVLTSDGYGKIVGRLKDMIIRGGENIFPSEVENFLQHHPDIVEVHVYGVSDYRMGEEVCASIKLKAGSNVTEEDIKDFCKGKISHFKIPRYIKFVDDFPKTASGKIKKYVLKETMEKELGNQV